MRISWRSHDDRVWGVLLVAFVAVQLIYLFFDIIVLSPPAPDAAIDEFRQVARDHAALIRWHALIPLFNLVFLLLPASVMLGRRLKRMAGDASPWPDLVLPASVLLVAAALPGLLLFAVLGLVPVNELSDSLIRGAVMENALTIWGIGGAATAAYMGAVSLALLEADAGPKGLARFGLGAAVLALVGEFWLINGNFNGPLFNLTIAGRGLFLLWLVLAGVWWYRAGRVGESVTDAHATRIGLDVARQ